MRRAVFFVILVACGAPDPARVEIARPLPTVSAKASTTAAAAWVELRKSGDPGAGDLVTSFPTYAKIDEATYHLGLEHEMAGDRNGARRTYFDVIKKWPSSRLVPYGRYAFGEMFYEEAKTDASKWMLAQQAFMEAVKFSASPIAKAASCRLDQTRRHESDAQACGGG